MNLRAGVERFNAHEFWEAHEAWETIWLVTTGEEKRFLQGLIQLAAAYHHVRRGTFRGAVRLFAASLQKLEPYPAGYLGVGREGAISTAVNHQERIARGEAIDPSEFPKLRYN